MKDFEEDNFEFDENGRKFSIRVESTVGKGEIARYEQFLLFPQCFLMTCTADTKNPGLLWERVNPFPNKPWSLRVCRTSLWKMQWEKEQLLVTSNFSLSPCVLYLFQ